MSTDSPASKYDPGWHSLQFVVLNVEQLKSASKLIHWADSLFWNRMLKENITIIINLFRLCWMLSFLIIYSDPVIKSLEKN